MQDWGEEVEEGAIYNVTLKRVQIQQAANKGARWLGVSPMSTPRFYAPGAVYAVCWARRSPLSSNNSQTTQMAIVEGQL